ncbi:hypothetical protein ASE63_08065 [Bosea sp. Root381]|nr:hypothetical protein ASE63_08065 [Bosea sp. Root381]
MLLGVSMPASAGSVKADPLHGPFAEQALPIDRDGYRIAQNYRDYSNRANDRRWRDDDDDDDNRRSRLRRGRRQRDDDDD